MVGNHGWKSSHQSPSPATNQDDLSYALNGKQFVVNADKNCCEATPDTVVSPIQVRK